MRRAMLQKIGDNIPTNNLILYQRFNNNVNDQTGLNTPTSTGIAYVNGLYSGLANQAAEMNNISDQITIPDSPAFSFGNGTTDVPFSISFAFNPDNFGVLQGGFYTRPLVLKRGTGAVSTPAEWQLSASNTASATINLILYDNSTGGTITKTTTTVFSNLTTYHLIVTYDGSGSASGITFYVDGILDSGTIGGSGTYVAMEDSSVDVRVGYVTFGSNSIAYYGRFDGLGIWDIELDSTVALSVYNKQSSGLNIL